MDEKNLGCIFGGLLLCVVGVLMVAGGTDTEGLSSEVTRNSFFYIGWLVAGAGALLAQIGVVAIGVRMGMAPVGVTRGGSKTVFTPGVEPR